MRVETREGFGGCHGEDIEGDIRRRNGRRNMRCNEFVDVEGWLFFLGDAIQYIYIMMLRNSDAGDRGDRTPYVRCWMWKSFLDSIKEMLTILIDLLGTIQVELNIFQDD